MVVNSSDTSDFMSGDDIVIAHTEKYLYLGNIITNEPLRFQVSKNLVAKEPQLHKYSYFFKDKLPYWVKLKVLESAMNSSLFYDAKAG